MSNGPPPDPIDVGASHIGLALLVEFGNKCLTPATVRNYQDAPGRQWVSAVQIWRDEVNYADMLAADAALLAAEVAEDLETCDHWSDDKYYTAADLRLKHIQRLLAEARRSTIHARAVAEAARPCQATPDALAAEERTAGGRLRIVARQAAVGGEAD